jgi:hypothetical protein
MSSSKAIDLSKDFAADVYLSEANIPIPHSIHTVFVYTVLIIHTRKGGVGGELNQR